MLNPKTRVWAQPKPGFLGLKNGRISRVPGFGETRVYNPTCIVLDGAHELYYLLFTFSEVVSM